MPTGGGVGGNGGGGAGSVLSRADAIKHAKAVGVDEAVLHANGHQYPWFHGTSAGQADDIEREGFNPGFSGTGGDAALPEHGTILGRGVFLTDSQENAAAYATHSSSPNVGFTGLSEAEGKTLEVVPTVQNVASWKNGDLQTLIADAMDASGGAGPGTPQYREALEDLAQKRGFDGLLKPSGGPTDELLVFDPKNAVVVEGSATTAIPPRAVFGEGAVQDMYTETMGSSH